MRFRKPFVNYRGAFLIGTPQTFKAGVRQLQLRTTIGMTNTLWKCEQLRAGQITNSVVFDTEAQAHEFVGQMRRVEPDIFWRIEPVDAGMVWN